MRLLPMSILADDASGLRPWTLAVLIAVLAASLAVLLTLMRRYTHGRQRQRAGEWASTWSGRADRTLPPWLDGSGVTLKVLEGWRSPTRWAVRVRAARTPGSRQPLAASDWAVAAVRAEVELHGDAGRAFAALRPVAATSLVDFFSVAGERPATAGPAVRLLSYPSLDVRGADGSPLDGFTCFADADGSARMLADSGVASVLHPAMSLLVRDGWVVVEATGVDGEGNWAAAVERGMSAAMAAAACLGHAPAR